MGAYAWYAIVRCAAVSRDDVLNHLNCLSCLIYVIDFGKDDGMPS
jgi:ethanolamine utilization cobalamin adenosyltransferase